MIEKYGQKKTLSILAKMYITFPSVISWKELNRFVTVLMEKNQHQTMELTADRTNFLVEILEIIID